MSYVVKACWLLAALALPARAGDGIVERKAEALVEAALGTGRSTAPPPGRALFGQVLASPAFVGAEVGPFDVRVRLADGLRAPGAAKHALEQVVAGLKPAADFVSKHFSRPDGLVSGHRFTLVFADADVGKGETSFTEILALLDLCEDGGYSGWKPDLPVDNDANENAPVVSTWEVLVFNLGHTEAKSDPKAWFAHGIGYRTLNMLSNLLLEVGAFGPVPPWLQQGLADELDISAYGTAWVAAGESESWHSEVSGWRSTGWSGFLPDGVSPPPPVYDPPKDLGTTYEKHVDDDGWIARGDSPTRHWAKLAADLRGAAPPSLQRSATTREYTPRDRAWARLVLHLMLAPGARPEGVPDLLEALDQRPPPTLGGLRGGEALTVVVARALGGVQAMEALESQTLREQLVAEDRAHLVQSVTDLGARDMLELRDHRDQSAWLYHDLACDPASRQSLFNVIVDSAYAKQLREWEVVGAALDRATAAAVATAKTFPREPDKLAAVGHVFGESLATPVK